MKRSSSADYQSIGQSLKRVKISTSMGELRLDRDIESLVFGKRWTSTACNNNAMDNNGNWNANHRGGSSVGRGGRIHGELYCHNATLVRDPVDPLRLRLTYLHQPSSSNNNNATQHSLSSVSTSPIPPERWTFVIQMPRMYPHVPPAISRVSRDLVPNNENINGNFISLDYNHNNFNHSASAAMVASSVMQSSMEPPVPEQVLVQPLPPTPHHHHSGSYDTTGTSSGGSSKLLDIDLATSVCNTWSPISSLQDLIDFLMGIPARRRDWWGVEGNRRHHQQQLRMRVSGGSGAAGGGMAPVGQPTIAPASNSVFGTFGNHQQQQNYQLFHHHSATLCEMEADGEMMMEDTSVMKHDFPSGAGARTISTPERRANPCAMNRFDVGYDRSGGPMRTSPMR